jgi:EAL domain-containing protein (putative c-di-GMP-specific phosphodiesterase class I)
MNRLDSKSENEHELLASWLELPELQGTHSPATALISDASRLPTLPFLIDRLGERLGRDTFVSLLLIRVDVSEAKELLGWKTPDEVMHLARRELQEIKNSSLRTGDFLAETVKGANSFAIVLAPPRKKAQPQSDSLSTLAERLSGSLQKAVEARTGRALAEKVGIYTGSSVLQNRRRDPLQHLVAKAVDQALENCMRQQLSHKRRKENLRKSFYLRQGVTTVFQPVISLDSAEMVAYKALVKTPEGELESPERVSRLSGEEPLFQQLRRTYLASVLHNKLELGDLPLFVELDPLALGKAELHRLTAISLKPSGSLFPERIVLALSEERLGDDFELCKSMTAYFRALRYKTALSEVSGTCHSFETMSQSLFDYVSLDRRLCRDIEHDEAKQATISTLVRLSQNANLCLIACGLEKQSDVTKIKDLGVPWGWITVAPPESNVSSFVVASLMPE